MSCDQTILARLSSLESKDEAKTKEMKKLRDNIYVLQKENFDFRTELFNIQSENDSLKEKLEVVEKKMASLIQDVPGDNKALTQDSKTDVNTNDNLRKRVLALEKKTRRMGKKNQDLRTKNSTLTSKFATVETTVNQLSGLQKILNRSLVIGQNKLDVDKKVDELCRRTDAVEIRNGNVSRSVTSVSLRPRGNLSTGNWIKLDKLYKVYLNKGVFDQRSCCLVPQCDGEYGVGVMFQQEGEGTIAMKLDWDRSGNYGLYVGWTDNHLEMCFGMQLLSFKKGQKVWVQALRKAGEADIGFCQVFFWLLS